MQKLVFINGAGTQIDLTAGNFGITNWSGLSNTSLNIQTQQVPFEDGGVFLDALMEQREIEVTVAIYDGNNLELRYQKKRELISALNPKLGEGTLIYTNNHLSRQIKAVPQIPLFENKNSNDAGTLKASVAFSCPSPYWEDVEDTVVIFDETEQPIIENTGDVPCQLEIEWFTGGVTNGALLNVTKNQKIEYLGTLNNSLKINTNLGAKSVVSEEMKFGLKNIGKEIKDIYFNDYTGEMFAVGVGGLILKSNNGGEVWEKQTSGTTLDLLCITYIREKNKYLIGCASGKILTSSDGITWTLVNIASGDIIGVAFASNIELFVVCDGSWLYTSSDGITWNTVVPDESIAVIHRITYSAQLDLLIAVGDGGVMTSTNVENWTVTPIVVVLRDIAYNNNLGLYIAVGSDGNGNECIYTSTNLQSWNLIATLGQGELSSVACSNNIIIAIGGINNDIYTSLDGINWNLLNINISQKLNRVIYTIDLSSFYIAGGEGIILKSQNGLNWESVTPSISNRLTSITQSLKLEELAFATYIGNFITTKDLANWNKTQLPFDSVLDIVYAEKIGLFVAVTSGLEKSTDGENWEIINYPTMPSLLNKTAIVYSEKKGMFVVVGRSGQILISPDASNYSWVKKNTGLTQNLYDVVYAQNKDIYVVVGDSGAIAYSQDLDNWHIATTSISENLRSVCYSEKLKLFVAVGANGSIYTSANGDLWFYRQSGISQTLNSVTYSEGFGIFIAVGLSGKIITSSDGITWNTITTPYEQDLYCVYFSTLFNIFVICGNDGIIITDYYLPQENRIQNISQDSDLNMNLGVGKNKFRITKSAGNMVVQITYRQKYIGV